MSQLIGRQREDADAVVFAACMLQSHPHYSSHKSSEASMCKTHKHAHTDASPAAAHLGY